MSDSGMCSTARVAIAHDYLTQRGGAERVALELARTFPDAVVYTTVFNPDATFDEFSRIDVRVVSWLDRIPGVRKDVRRAMPLLPLAVSSVEIDADVLLCSSSGWSHGFKTPGVKIVYCHNPARWLYQPDAYFGALPAIARRGISRLLRPLRAWDIRAACSCRLYVANSRNVAGRIKDIYNRKAVILHPPRGIDPAGPQEAVPGLTPGFYLTISRNRGYKRSRDIARAFESSGRRLVQVGGDDVEASQVTRVSGLRDAQLRWLYANARALIAVGDEDFGLTPVECYAFGTPAIVLAAGGYLETASPDATIQIDSTSPRDILRALHEVEARMWDKDAIREHSLQWSPERFRSQLRRLVEDQVMAL